MGLARSDFAEPIAIVLEKRDAFRDAPLFDAFSELPEKRQRDHAFQILRFPRVSLRLVQYTGFDLAASAHDEMIRQGFHPDFPAGADAELAAARQQVAKPANSGLRDLRNLLWSSIDNASSRDLDQIEVAERTADGIRVRIGVADVDSVVHANSALDAHAASETTTVYTPAKIFPMLPIELSTDLTSLNQKQDRAALVIELVVSADGSIVSSDIYRALVQNQAQLAYETVGPWLETSGAAPSLIAASAELAAQLRLQDEAARSIRAQRQKLGALNFDRTETQPVMVNGAVTELTTVAKNRATKLIEDFMIAANEVMARTLSEKGVANIRRVVKSPERWPRIAELAASHGTTLPENPDSAALAQFLQDQKVKDPAHYPDLSLAVIKLLGPGEYVLSTPGSSDQGHFGLAAQDYTHSTAPNRRFADLVTQRLIKACLAGSTAPYSDDQLTNIAQNCTLKEDAARKVERVMGKRVAAVAFQNRRGENFDAIVTGVAPKGVFVRTLNPAIEGRLMCGESGVDVGDRIRVTLLNTDPEHGFIDFGR